MADGSMLERHTQTIISSVVLAILLWTGVTLLDVQNRVVRIEAFKEGETGRERKRDDETIAFRHEILSLVREHEARIKALELSNARRKE